MKSISRLVALGAVASGAGGVLLAVSAPTASASPSVSASNTLITSPQMVTVTAHVDPLNTAVLYFDGAQKAALTNPVHSGQTLSYTFNAGQLGNGTYPVEVREQTASLSPLTQTAWSSVTVRIPPPQPAGSSSGSSGSSGHSGAVSGGSAGGTGGGTAPAAGNGAGAAPAAIGYNGPSSGGTGFGSAYSRLDSLSGGSGLVLPNVAPQNGFQLPVKPQRQTRLADSPSRGSSLTAATWLIGVALGLIMLLTTLRTGAWARRRHHRKVLAAATAGARGDGGAVADGGAFADQRGRNPRGARRRPA